MTPRDLLAIPRVVELLGQWPFDFAIGPEESPCFHVEERSFELFAGDGGGNVFAFLDDGSEAEERPILYVSHEGRAGVIARTLEEAIRLFLAVPDWKDLLKFSGGGNLDVMVEAQPRIEERLVSEVPEIVAIRRELGALLGLEPLPDAARVLHRNVKAYDVVVASNDDGEPCDPLFNRFTLGN